MPDLTLTVTNDQWTRIQSAFGTKYPEDTINGTFMAAWIKAQIKDVVQDMGGNAAAENARTSLASDLATEGWDD